MNFPNLDISSRLGKANLGESYLKIELNKGVSAALPMKDAQEVIMVPVGRITPMPNMPDCTLGLLNQRSRVFWVIDLGQMLELKALDTDTQNYNIIIVRVGNIPLGLAVAQVKGMMRLNKDNIQSPFGTVSQSLTPYLEGCVLQDERVLLIFNAESIVNSSILQSN